MLFDGFDIFSIEMSFFFELLREQIDPCSFCGLISSFMTEGSDYRACLDVYLDTSGGILYLRKLSLFYMSYSYFLSSAIYKADLSVFEVYKSSYLSC